MSREMNRISRDTIRTYGKPPTTPEEALAHVLCAFAQLPNEEFIVTATDGIYGNGVRTGLTMGDLRALQQQLDQVEQPVAADVVRLRPQV